MTTRPARASAPFRRRALAIFLVAWAVRMVHVLQLRRAPFFGLTLGDSGFFDAWAREIAGGAWLGQEVFWYAPLYPYALGLHYRLLGDEPMLVRSIQVVIGAASCALLALAGRRLFDRRTGIVAGLGLALYAPAIFYDALLHKPVLAMFFLCLLLWILGGLVEPGSGARAGPWLALGLALGGLTLTRENGLVFVGPILLWLALGRSAGGRRRWAAAALLLAGIAVVLFPVAVRNRVVGGELHVTAANFGDNFYKGNHEGADGVYRPLRPGRGSPRYERQDAIDLAEAAAGRPLSPSEVSRYWTGLALDYIRAQPGDWLLLMGRKVLLLVNAIEWPDSEDLYTHAEWSVPLRWLGTVAHLGVLVPLAVLGFWVTWERRRELWPLHLMLVTYGASVVVFYVFGRYRYPIVPFLLLFAAAGLVGLYRFGRSASKPRLAACGLSVAVAAVACNWPFDTKQRIRSGTEVNIGGELRDAGRAEEALEHFRRAMRLDPGNASAPYNLGVTLGALGRSEQALQMYRRTLEVKPDHVNARINLGVALAQRGDLDAARRELEAALAVEPDNVAALGNLSRVYELAGDAASAVRLAERAAARSGYRDLWALERLEAAHVAARDLAGAARTVEAALRQADASGDAAKSEELRRRLSGYRRAQGGGG